MFTQCCQFPEENQQFHLGNLLKLYQIYGKKSIYVNSLALFNIYTCSISYLPEYYILVIVYNFKFSKYYTKQYKKGAKYEFIMYKNQQ